MGKLPMQAIGRLFLAAAATAALSQGASAACFGPNHQIAIRDLVENYFSSSVSGISAGGSSSITAASSVS
jgi:hypothetical protein